MTKLNNSQMGGSHYLCELFGCSQMQINNAQYLRESITKALSDSSLIALHEYFYEFSPQGITGFVLLSTSHISLHTWPEHGYIALDIFSCGDEIETEFIVNTICSKIDHAKRTQQLIKRGHVV